jgi:dihydroxyacetone kinase phosphoprotein-dependent L subunit
VSYVLNSPQTFKNDALDGLAAAYGRYLRRLPGASAVVSVSAPAPGRVSTIIGGGSGHFPAFAGLVGPGLADAAVCGEIFASPSATQVYRTIRAVSAGAGVLMLFGNYQGDVMHFGLAADQAITQDGIEVRIVRVTDDIASAPPERLQDRRGIAGGFFVFRAAAAAAHREYPLEAVERIAASANAATRTIGVAFEGCTIPGHEEPMFTLPAGSMALGLGIHGEPGILTVERMAAKDLGSLLVERLLEERPAHGDRARVMVNGLGRVKSEELFILYRSVADELAKGGVELTEPEVGELVTSLDMAGCSVTLVWTDDELEELLSTPAATAGYVHLGPFAPLDRQPVPLDREAGSEVDPPEIGDRQLAESGRVARRALMAMAESMRELEGHLGDLDAVAADGDHGTTMTRGMDAAVQAGRRAGPDAGAILVAAGMAFADAAGGASGALWGSGLTTIGAALFGGAGCPEVATLSAAFTAALESITRLGGSAPGEKTLIDALHPFVRAFREAAAEGASMTVAWQRAVDAAAQGAESTAAMPARRGRASWLSERSIGVEDPGAVSLAAALAAVGRVLTVPGS